MRPDMSDYTPLLLKDPAVTATFGPFFGRGSRSFKQSWKAPFEVEIGLTIDHLFQAQARRADHNFWQHRAESLST